MNAKPTAAATPQREIKTQDIITLTARLAQLLAEEVDLLSEMKVSKIEALQKEKLFLINALDSIRRQAEKMPQFSETIPSQDRKDLQEVVDVFNNILEENHRKLLMAREVNHKIVQAITEVVREHTASKVYDVRGVNGLAPYSTLSVTLNQTI
jgi:flagellar biosynthesis/type III secretory pathway chaperone